jgi:hypothetical protein
VTTPPSKGVVVELYLIYFGLAQSFVDDSSIEWAVVSVRVISVKRSEIVEEEAVKTYVVKKWCMRTKSAYHSHSRHKMKSDMPKKA